MGEIYDSWSSDSSSSYLRFSISATRNPSPTSTRCSTMVPARHSMPVSEHVVGQLASSPPLTVVTFVTGLTVPWDLDFTPDGTMLFTERRGVLKARLTDGAVQEIAAGFRRPVCSWTHRTPSAGRGSELCVQPAVLYVAGPHWTRNAGHRLGPSTANYTTATRVADPLVGGMPVGIGRLHSGGRLIFRPQGYLWIAVGDGYSGTAPQDLSSLGGKVLRIDSQMGVAAPGNPFESSLVYVYGFQNPQGGLAAQHEPGMAGGPRARLTTTRSTCSSPGTTMAGTRYPTKVHRAHTMRPPLP